MANPSLKELYDSGLFEEIGGEENNTISLPGYDSAPGYDTSTPSPIKQTGFEKLNTPAAMPVELQQRRSDNDLFKRVLSISGGKYNQDASGVLFTPKDETHLKNTLSSLDSSGVPFKAQSQPDGSFLFTLTNKSGAGMVQGDAGSSGGSGPGFDTFQSVPAGSTHNPSLQSLLDSGMFEEYRVGDGQFDYDQKEMEVGSNGPKKPGLLKTAGKGLIHSALGLGESIGTGLEYLENRLDPTENKTNHWGLGETAKRFWRKQADKFLPSEEIYGKNIVDNPELLANAEWWAYNVADMMPALAASIIPGSIAFKGAQAVPILAKAAPLIGSVAGGLFGGALEGTQTYNAVLEKGGTEEEAARAGELMTAGSAVLNALSVGKVLSKAGNTFKGKVLKHLGAGAWEGITEGLEEPTEVFAKYFGAYLAGEKLPNDLTSQLIDSAKEALTVAPVAAVTGFGGSVMSGDHATSKEKLDNGPDNIKTPDSAPGDIDIQAQPGPADGSPSPSPAAGIQEQPGPGLVDTVPVDTAPIQNSEPRQQGVPFFDPVEEFKNDIQPGQGDIQFKDSTVNLSDTHKEIAKDAIREVFSEISNESEKFGDFLYEEQVNQFEKNLRQANDEIQDYSIPDVRPDMTPAQNEAIGRMEQAELETEARRISAGIENNEDPFLNPNRENPQQSVSLQSTQKIEGKEPHPVGVSKEDDKTPPLNVGLKDTKQQAFVDNRIAKLGSVEAVDKAYNRDDLVSRYAKAKAREIFWGIQAQSEISPIYNQTKQDSASIIDQVDTAHVSQTKNNTPDATDASAPMGVTQTVKENLTVAPGAPVTWQDKKGNTLSGVLVKKRYKDKPIWRVKKDDGKTTFVSEKDFQIGPANTHPVDAENNNVLESKPEIVKSKGHIGFFTRSNTNEQVEVYRTSNGDIYTAPVSNVIDVDTGNRIGQFEAPEHMADYAVGRLLNIDASEIRGSQNRKYEPQAGLPLTDDPQNASVEQQSNKTGYGTTNKIFTADIAEKARETLRKKLSGSQLNSGIDPEIMLAGIQLAGYHIEAGARSFADYSKAMIQDVGETVKPYLRSFYEGVRYFPEFDPAGMTDAKDIDDSTRKTDNTDIPTNKERENVPQHDTGTDTERDRGDSGAIDGLGKKNVSYGSGPATGTDGEGVRPTVETGGTGSSQISSGHETSPAGKRGDQSPYSTDGPVGSEGRNAGSDNDTRGGDVGFNGGQPDRIPAETVVNAAQKRDDFKSKITAQKRAANVKTVHADLSNIQETLPLLHPGQQEDVLFAEKRFSKPDGHGVMYTNGTGTGKTFSALGIIKRFERDGKKNILVIAPDNVIINAWTNAAILFDIHMHKLADTKDAGQDVTITTYANFRDNQKLVSRDWDLVIADESHELSMNKSGGKTSSLAMFRAITKNPRGVQNRAALLFPRLFNKRGDSKKNHDAWTKVLDKVRNDIAAANKNGSRSKAVFLSATPFAYEKNIDYAEGYLFDYGPERDDLAYNATDAYQQFMVEHFGYRMRYNKLTEPDAEVNRGLMQRQFNSWLKQQGVLSSRVLSVDYDYDRRFVLTESAIGQKIDDGFEFLRENYKEYAELLSYIQDDFDYLQRRYLLEAIKAKEVVPIIKDHLAHGRKVVVFHDYIKGGAHNPFDVSSIIDQKTTDGAITGLAEQAKKFAAARPDLVNLPIDHLPSPLTMLQRSFPDLLVVNGQTVSKKEMQKNINAFNDDATGPCVLMVQSDKDKGWSGHDTTGKHQRVLINLGLPTRPTRAIQQEGRIYRVGQASDAIFRYLNTGTNWERWAFASTIAKRASAAENLAMGEEARALQDSFINAFEESDTYPVGMAGEGKGGKAQDIANNAALTEWDRAMSFYFGQQKKTARTKAAEGQDYFATPEPLGLKMVEWAGIESGDSVLEPSAGHGAIARWFPENIDATVIEPSAELSSRLKMVTPDSKVIQDNFESHHVTNKYDAVIMNPPFGTAGKTAMEHVEKAFKHLRHGGRVVAIIPNGPAMEKRLDKFLYGEDDKGKVINSNAHLTADFILPAATFERAGTKVSSRVVVIDKTLDTGLIQQTKKDFSDISDVKEFFNRIKETDVPGRGETDSKKSEAKYSVSPNLNTTVKPEQVLTRQDILSAFPGQTSLINPDNSISIRLDNGQGLKINTVEHIGGDDYRLAVQYGLMDKNGVILGKYQDRTITLNKNLATNFTVNHEIYHFLVDMGMVTPREQLLLRSEHGKMVKSGTVGFKSSDIREENEANTFAQILKDRAAYRGTRLGSLIQKVADFIDGLLHVGRASVRKLAREVESGEVYGRPADDQGKENKAPSFSTTDDFHKQFEEDETNAFKTGLDYFTGMVKHFRENPDNDVEDIHAVAHILKTTMYNAEKIGGAYKRLFDVMRKRNDYKVEKQNELWKAGERSLLEELSLIYKNDKAAAAELNTYLVDKDIAAQGFTIKKKDGEYHLFHWKKEKNGERKLIGSFSSEDQAERVSILTEASESELSENAKTGLVLFRQMSHNLYHHFASDIEQIIKAHEEAGEPAPQVVIQTQDGTTKVDLKVAAAMMGDRRGYYFPRQRQSGQYMVIMGKDGEADQLQFFDTKMFARGYRSKWEKRGYEQKAFKKVGKISEDLFQSLGSLMDQEAVFNKALEQVTDSARHRNLEDINLTGEWRDKDFVVTGRGLGGVEEEMLKGIGGEYVDRFVGRKYMPMVIFRDVSANQIESLEDKVTKTLLRSKAMFPDMDLAFSKALVQQYDTELKGRGARSRMIGRSDAVGPNVKRGYETNALIAITQAMQAAAGSYAKARIAKKGIAAITGLDISWNDFQQNDKRSKTAAALKLELENLNLASPDQIEHKTVLKQHLQSVRRELESLDALDTDKIIKRQQEVKRLLKEIRSITRWVDADKARNLQAKINEIQTGMHEDYLKQVKERRIDAAMQPTVYEEATTALKDILKNDEAADRIIGTIKGLAVFKYLGFRVSSAAINMTNMVTGVPAAINGETEDKVGIRSALRHIGDAFKDYGLHRAGKLADKDKQLVYDEIREKGWDSPVFNKEAFSILHGKLGRGLNRALETSMLMFGKTEEMNRAATIAGTYFAMKKAYTEKGEAWDHDAMMQAAKNISDKAHGVYGKESMPHHMRGKNIGARVLQMTYVFQTFMHNYLQEMWRLGVNKKQYKAAAYMAFSPAIFGLGATVPMGIAKAIANALDMDDPEEAVIQVAEDNFGTTFGNFARYGITGMSEHGISLKGSLATRFGTPDSVMDLFGAPGSVLGDVFKGYKNLSKGYYMDALENVVPTALGNISKGIREATTGVTTKNGNPVYFGNEKVKGDILDTVLRVMSFNPTHISKKKEIRWNEYRVIQRYKEKKSDLYTQLRRKIMAGQTSREDMIEWEADARDFNTELQSKGILRIVPPITRKSIKSALRELNKAPKRERMRQAVQ